MFWNKNQTSVYWTYPISAYVRYYNKLVNIYKLLPHNKAKYDYFYIFKWSNSYWLHKPNSGIHVKSTLCINTSVTRNIILVQNLFRIFLVYFLFVFCFFKYFFGLSVFAFLIGFTVLFFISFLALNFVLCNFVNLSCF